MATVFRNAIKDTKFQRLKQLKSLPTQKLIFIVQDNNESRESKKDAYLELYNRFGQDVLNKCEIVCRCYGYSAVEAENIFERVWGKYLKNPNFQQSKCRGKNIDEGFLLYLFKIAEYTLIDLFRSKKRNEEGPNYDGTEHVISELPKYEIDDLSEEHRVHYEAINSLSAKEKTVYLTYQAYEVKGYRLPRKLLSQLREQLGITNQTTLRGIKKNATDKVEACLNAHKLVKNGYNEQS